MLTATQSIADVVSRYAETAAVFQRHRIDFCCHGNVSIEHAATERGLDVATLMHQLGQAIAERTAAAERPSVVELSTPALVDRIVTTHHAYLRKTLPYLQPLAIKVARVHGDHNPKLAELRDAVVELVDTLLPHLDDEEAVLFPALCAGGPVDAQTRTMLDTMLDEHHAVAKLLERIRTASDDFEIPTWACGSYRALFRELETVEQDTFVHVHLENHVLKPRFDGATAPLQLDLAAEAAELAATPAWRDVGHTAKTLVRNDDTRIVLIALRAGARMIEHQTDSSIQVQVLTGRVQLHTPHGRIELAPQELLFLDEDVPHDVVAREDSSVLLTINWRATRTS